MRDFNPFALWPGSEPPNDRPFLFLKNPFNSTNLISFNNKIYKSSVITCFAEKSQKFLSDGIVAQKVIDQRSAYSVY